ncbi:hypothetical protein JL720_4456 [Aureococcus anophagefferens]|nr:hypothetical protein JL720_4456 [Aureococcus anophagefferens]
MLALRRVGSIGVAAVSATLNFSSCEEKQPRFAGKTIVITGGGGTFGRVGAKYFAKEGANVVLVDVNRKALDEAMATLPGANVEAVACDVRDADSGQMKPLLEYSAKDVQLVMDINVVGGFNVLQACARDMAGRGGGAVVQTGSVAGLRGTPTMNAYVASKAAVHGLTMTAAKDLAPHKIRVNTVMPALIGPEDGFMWKRQNELHAASGSPYFDRDADVLAKKKVGGVPLKRLGEVEEVVEAVRSC